jgi:hypothetical protein
LIFALERIVCKAEISHGVRKVLAGVFDLGDPGDLRFFGYANCWFSPPG